MKSKLTKETRNYFYKKVLEEVVNCPYEIFICNSLTSKGGCGIKKFVELTRFYPKQLEDTAWIHEQLDLDNKKPRLKWKGRLKIAKEYRIFILQLCIEMSQ